MHIRRALQRSLIAVLLLAFSVGAKQRSVGRDFVPDPPPRDIFSAAEPADVRTKHLALDLAVDFDARVVRGSVTHTIVNFTGTRRLVLDTRDLAVSAVTIDGRPAAWSLGPKTDLGQPLTIEIEPSTRVVRIDYASTPGATGLHWLTARQTLGDVLPFLYAQNEPDDARSWIPVQDTPGVRMTYEATLRVPPGMLALMTAPNPTEPNDSGVYRFRMDQPIAPYLIVLAAGRLAFRPLDEHTGVYAEPEMIDDAVWDMQFVPAMFAAAEGVLGPYPWGRYDMLFLPSFVAGGMENPRLNFLTPGLILGNGESPVPPHGYIAHELAHSWGGDLVTCATWSDTWLNEGFATYYEKRFYEALGDDERAELGYFFDLQAFADAAGSLAPASTVLHRQFGAADSPNSAFNTTSYQKGSLFFLMLDDVMGRETFDGFMRRYLQRNAYHWVDDRAFLAALQEAVLDARPDLAPRLRLNEWIYGTGMPANVTAPVNARIWDRVGVQAQAFRRGTPASSLNRTGWTSIEVSIFLQQIADIIRMRMPELDAAFGFSLMNTPPIHWMIATAQTMYTPGIPSMERFILRGSSPNILSVYSTLAQTASGRVYARSLYERARDDYPPEMQGYLDSLLGKPVAAAA